MTKFRDKRDSILDLCELSLSFKVSFFETKVFCHIWAEVEEGGTYIKGPKISAKIPNSWCLFCKSNTRSTRTIENPSFSR